MPPVAGNKIPNKSWKVSLPFLWLPAAPFVSLGFRFSKKVCQLSPVNSTPSRGTENGFKTIAERGMLKVAISKMKSNPLLALAKMPLPARQIAVQRTRTMVSQRYSHQKPSSRKFDQVPDLVPKF